MIFTQVPKVTDKTSDFPIETNDISSIELKKRELVEKTYRLTILLRAIVKLGHKSFSEYDSFCIENIKGHPIYGIVLPSQMDVEIDKCIDLIQTSGSISKALLAYREQMMKGFSKESRQKDGKVYTPPEIVKWIHDKLEQYNPIDLNKTYWEPASGTGSFVIDWYERLMKHWIENKEKYSLLNEEEAHKWIIEKCLYYSDIDPFAIRLCTLQLFLKNPRVKGIKYNSYCGDSLLDEPFKQIEKFDYVAGNPPYGRARYASYNKLQLESKWSKLQVGEYNIYKAFIEMALTKGKSVGYIVPATWLSSSQGSNVRNMLLSKKLLGIKYCSQNSKIFDKVTQAITSFVVDTQIESSKTDIIELQRITASKLGEIYLIEREKLITSKRFIIVTLSKKHHNLSLKIANTMNCNSLVFKTGEVNIGLHKIALSSLPTDVPYCNGKMIGAYRLDLTKGKLWINLDICTTSQKQGIFGPKIIMQQISGPGAGEFGKWIKATFVSVPLCPSSNYNNYCLVTDVSEGKISIAILNSNVINFIYSTLTDSNGTSAGSINDLSFPTFDSRLDPLVDKMLLDPNDKVTEAEINKIVYELYGLTEEEIKIIEDTVK